VALEPELVRVDALALDCLPEVEHARQIVTGGTSAHRQLATYNQAIEKGADKKQALDKAVDFLIEETMAGL
jgi:carboxylate-amine ligase